MLKFTFKLSLCRHAVSAKRAIFVFFLNIFMLPNCSFVALFSAIWISHKADLTWQEVVNQATVNRRTESRAAFSTFLLSSALWNFLIVYGWVIDCRLYFRLRTGGFVDEKEIFVIWWNFLWSFIWYFRGFWFQLIKLENMVCRHEFL